VRVPVQAHPATARVAQAQDSAEPALFPELTVAENIALGLEREGLWRRVDWKKRRERASALLAEVGARIDVDAEAGELTMPEQQLVEIARAIGAKSRVVIMDEPTAALGVKESRMVLDLIRRVRDKGLPVIFISHNMPHVFDVADRIHIARLGKRVAVVSPREISMADAVAIMTGAV